MADTSNLRNFLQDVADAIKEKKDYASSQKIQAEDFDTEILSIETGIDTSDATATSNDIIAPKTAYVNGRKLAGTMIATEKTLSVQDYAKYSVLPNAPTKLYNDSMAISGYTINVTEDDTNLYIDAIRDNTLLKHQEFALSDLGFYTGSRNIAVSYNSMTSNGIDIVVGRIRLVKQSDNTGLVNFQFKKFLFSLEENTIIENSTLLDTNWTIWLGSFAAQIPNIIADRSNKNLFHMITNREDYGQRTIFRNFTVSWNDLNVGTLDFNMGEVRINSSYQNNQLVYTGDGNYLAYCRGIIQFTNETKSAIAMKDIGSPMYLSHNKEYLLIGTTVYKVTPSSDINALYNSRVAIGTVVSNTDGFFSQNDNYLIVITSTEFKVYLLSENEITLKQTISRSGLYTIPWDSNYMISNQNDNTGLIFYNCTGQTIIKQLERDNRTYYFAESDEVPSTSEVLLNKQYIGLNGILQIGTMPNNGQLDYTPSDIAQTIPLGYTNGGTISAVDITTLDDYKTCERIADNILSGTPLYTELEYIQSTGTQYINTGIIANNTFEFEMKFNQTSIIAQFDTVIGGQQSEIGMFVMNTYNRGSYNKSLKYNGSESKITLAGNYYQTDTVLSLENNVYTFNNGTQTETATVGAYTSFTGVQPVWLFGLNNNGNIFCPTAMKLYYCKIWSNGSLVRDLIPVKDLDDVVCMYDKVTNSYLYNIGSGNFIAGPEKEV